MIPSQMLKGLLEGAVLELVKKEDTYAYEISKQLEELGFGEVSEGTIYPIILRLQKQKFIVGEKRPSPSGPERKYYHLTTEGMEYLQEFKVNWKNLSAAINNLLEDNHD